MLGLGWCGEGGVYLVDYVNSPSEVVGGGPHAAIMRERDTGEMGRERERRERERLCVCVCVSSSSCM